MPYALSTVFIISAVEKEQFGIGGTSLHLIRELLWKLLHLCATIKYFRN